MYEQENIPFAPTLIESLRSIGYSFESAIADLLDNSISANSTEIEIIVSTDEFPEIIIVDNGYGMDKERIENAMKYGSTNPIEERSKNDLGRFGLGMKSASLSQCRSMIVASKSDSEVSAYSWDLDHIVETNSWSMIGYSKEEISKFPKIDKILKRKSGTYIKLSKFDRIQASTNNLYETLTKNIVKAEEHIALVFHRFIEDGIKIKINGRLIEARDPFLLNNKKTQLKREQKIKIGEEYIIAKPYILPHIANITKEDILKVGGKNRLKKEQGFYIYRNKRLIIWGTWFRLENKDELSKLARVKVDIPNTLDYMWNIDIKKSSANLPDKIKKSLYSSVVSAISESEKVYSYRGKRVLDDEKFQYVWERIQDKERSKWEYKINREIPQIKMMEKNFTKEQFKMINKLLEHIEENFPSASLYLDVGKGEIEKKNYEIEALLEDFKDNIRIMKANGIEIQEKYIAQELVRVEPYCRNQELIEKVNEIYGGKK